MPHRRGRTGALLAALALAAVTGCGGLDQTRLLGSDTGGALTTPGFGLGDEVATSRVDAFKAKYPDVDLQVTEGAFDAQQFLSAVASGRPPDLVYLDREVLGSYAHRGALEPLTSCVDRAGIRTGDFREAALDQVTVDGVVYGIPEFNIVPVVLVNTKAAAEAGVRPEEIDTSDWDGLRRLGERMTRREGGKLTRLGFYPKMPYFFPMWTKAAAVSVYDAAGGYPTVKAFNDSWDFFGERNQFATDQLLVFIVAQRYFVQGISTTGRTG